MINKPFLVTTAEYITSAGPRFQFFNLLFLLYLPLHVVFKLILVFVKLFVLRILGNEARVCW